MLENVLFRVDALYLSGSVRRREGMQRPRSFLAGAPGRLPGKGREDPGQVAPQAQTRARLTSRKTTCFHVELLLAHIQERDVDCREREEKKSKCVRVLSISDLFFHYFLLVKKHISEFLTRRNKRQRGAKAFLMRGYPSFMRRERCFPSDGCLSCRRDYGPFFCRI
jgi:hypothetical protein